MWVENAQVAAYLAYVARTLDACGALDLSLRQGTPRPRLGEAEVEAMIAKLGDMTAVVRAADPNDTPEVYQQMGLKLTYQPGQKVVQGGIAPKSQCLLTCEFLLGSRS
jgi:hypothetical protein